MAKRIFIDTEPHSVAGKRRERIVRDLYALLETPSTTEQQRTELIRVYARSHVAQYNQAVHDGSIEGEVLSEKDFEAQLKADYERFRENH